MIEQNERKVDDIQRKINTLNSRLLTENRPRQQFKLNQKIKRLRNQMRQLENR